MPGVDDVRARLAHVRWLGGGSGAGKSSVAAELARRYDVDVCSTDASMAEHAARLDAHEAPLLHRFLAMSLDERWVLRAPEEMLATFHWFAGEGFDLVVRDLLARPPDRVVVVEGFRLLPSRVRPLTSGTHAVWLLPTPGFRRAAFRARGSEFAIAGRTSDPARALENLLVRDAAFTRRVAAEAGAQGLVVDGTSSLAQVTDRVARCFGLVP